MGIPLLQRKHIEADRPGKYHHKPQDQILYPKYLFGEPRVPPLKQTVEIGRCEQGVERNQYVHVMGQLKLGKTDQQKKDADAAKGEEFPFGYLGKTVPQKVFQTFPVPKEGRDGPGQKDRQKGMEEEKEITAVLPHSFPAHPFKTLFPKDEEDSA